MNWAALGNRVLLGGWLYAAYLVLFDFLVLCLPRKVQLSVAAGFGDMDCLYSCREKQSPVQLDLMGGLPWTLIRNGTSSCMTQKESRWLFLNDT